MSTRVRIYVADDHPLFREGLVRSIKMRPEFELVGEAADGRAALAEIRELAPDVALLDQRMPELSGTEIINALRRERRRTRVVLLSAFTGSDLVYRAFGTGAAGFVSKEAGRDEILDAALAAARGEIQLTSAAQAGLIEQIQMRETRDRPALTAREQEVLTLVAEGLSAPDIAARLQLGTATIKSHLQALYEKLGVSDRAAAVAVAMRAGLLE